MAHWRGIRQPTAGYVGISLMSSACAVWFFVLHDGGVLPVIGKVSLPHVTIVAAALGYPLLVFVQSRLIQVELLRTVRRADAIALVGLGAMLSVPPILIDIAMPFPHDINVLPPVSLLFYAAIALVAEVVLHLAPLAVLAAVTTYRKVAAWMFVPVVLVEPALQAVFLSGTGLQAWLVFGNVTLISATQIWVFTRFGFGAMFALRIIFYLFWHVLWGSLRLHLLF